MREIVHLQAGQCGNQIGAKFWEIISDEHGEKKIKPKFLFDFSYSDFTDRYRPHWSLHRNIWAPDGENRCKILPMICLTISHGFYTQLFLKI